MSFSLEELTKSLLEDWADEVLILNSSIIDEFSTPGTPDATKWTSVLSPIVVNDHLSLTGTSKVHSIATPTEPIYLYATGLTFLGCSFPTVQLWKSGTAYVHALLVSPSILSLDSRNAGGLEQTQITLTDPNVNLLILFTSTSILFYINNVLVATHTTNIPTGPFDLRIGVGSIGTFLCNGVSLGSAYGKGRVRTVTARSKPTRFPDYINVLQADAILSIITDHNLPIEDGAQIAANNIQYLVKNKIEVMAHEAPIIERWSLWRDQTAPGQVLGVR